VGVTTACAAAACASIAERIATPKSGTCFAGTDSTAATIISARTGVSGEKAGIERGLQFNSGDVEAVSNRRCYPRSPALAYRLIARVRKRALDLSGEDPQGRHYFASLLFWSLRWLTLPAMRPTKKLLAIYSAARILRKLDD